MANSINLIAFGTFGNPNGFRQTFFVGNNDLSNAVKTFDLNTNAIKLFINSKVYAIRKEYVNGFNTIAYSVYSYAKEQNSDRSGTFIGSSILFTNKIAEEQITISQLNEFHDHLIGKNIQNDIITVNHSDHLVVKKPKEFDKIEFHLRQIENLNFSSSSNENLVVFCNTSDDQLGQFFRKSIDLLNTYDTIYFTDSREVAEFVNQKGIFKLIQNVGDRREFDREIEKLLEERKRKKELSISEFEREVQRLNDDKNRALQEFKMQIEQSERIHHENEKKIRESKEDLVKIEQIYIDFSKKIAESVNQLKSGSKLEEVKQVHNENKRRFINGVNQQIKPVYINKLSKINAKSGLHVENQNQEFERKNHQKKSSIEEKRYRIDLFKVTTIILGILLIFTWVYFVFFKTEEGSTHVKPQEQEMISQTKSTKSEIKTTILGNLNPTPNSELSAHDYRLVAEKLEYKTEIKNVVNIIFSKNPEDIGKRYKGQEDIYEKQLIKLNKTCFEEKGGLYLFSKDTIRHIPSYKR